ncbi:MAG TPA: hypothetical protein VFH56_14180 [Acidimicrobiales bacterium]|nr:hypothetical protein [Acidimicrobiales bacterium]
MTDETCNGYANRETWAFNLHWQNDQGLYRQTLEEARQIIKQDSIYSTPGDRELGERIVNYWRDVFDGYDADGTPMTQTLRMFEREVGSWWRINYAEVGAAVRESLDAEGL